MFCVRDYSVVYFFRFASEEIEFRLVYEGFEGALRGFVIGVVGRFILD